MHFLAEPFLHTCIPFPPFRVSGPHFLGYAASFECTADGYIWDGCLGGWVHEKWASAEKEEEEEVVVVVVVASLLVHPSSAPFSFSPPSSSFFRGFPLSHT